jgi:hypothetical protein
MIRTSLHVSFMNDLKRKLGKQKEPTQMELAADTAYEEDSSVECNEVEAEMQEEAIAGEKSNWRLQQRAEALGIPTET